MSKKVTVEINDKKFMTVEWESLFRTIKNITNLLRLWY